MYATTTAIRYANQQAGLHFFDADTLRYFRSRILSGVIGDGYFITSERYDDSTPRRYTIRLACPTGAVVTVGEFQQYATARAARKAAQSLAGL